MGKLVAKQEKLRRCEGSCGTGMDLRKMLRLRKELAALEKKLTLAEKLQENAIIGKETSDLAKALYDLADDAKRCRITPEEHDRRHAAIIEAERQKRENAVPSR
jgi:hypothetical protein